MISTYYPYAQISEREQRFSNKTAILMKKHYAEVMIEELASMLDRFKDDEEELYIAFETRGRL